MDNKLIYNQSTNVSSVSKSKMKEYRDSCFIYRFLKRVIDIICSILGIIVLSPVLIIVSILIKLESNGPIIFKQLRAGKDSKPFYIYKFRSMKVNTPNIATNDFSNASDYITNTPNIATNDFSNASDYITKTGRFIRKTSLDEIPQLFNILKGDMSIVGPRPVILEEVELIELRQMYNVDKILPGITGWAQINGRDNIGNEEKVKYDYEYLTKKSIIMDLYIIVMTALKVLKRSDIKE